MGRPQLGLPRLRVWATGIAIGSDHTPPFVTLQQNPRAIGAWFAGSRSVVIFSSDMAVSIEMHHTGDATLQREVAALIEHVLADRPGDWRVSIIGSQANDREMKVDGPNAFERSYTLEGSAGEHRPEVIRVILGRMLPARHA